METIVKKLNEIADAVAGEDVEDATNVADALVDIGDAFAGSEGKKVNNVVDALDYIKENVSSGGGEIEWRTFTIKYKNAFEDGFETTPITAYATNGTILETTNYETPYAEDEWVVLGTHRLPVINGVCVFEPLLTTAPPDWAVEIASYVFISESSGISVDEDYTMFSIDEDNAIIALYYSV